MMHFLSEKSKVIDWANHFEMFSFNHAIKFSSSG